MGVYLEKYVLINNKMEFTNKKQVCLNRNQEVLLPISIKTLLDNFQQLSCLKNSTQSYYFFRLYHISICFGGVFIKLLIQAGFNICCLPTRTPN